MWREKEDSSVQHESNPLKEKREAMLRGPAGAKERLVGEGEKPVTGEVNTRR